MNWNFDTIAGLVLNWLLIASLIGLTIGLVYQFGRRAVRFSTARGQYGWAFVCFSALSFGILFSSAVFLTSRQVRTTGESDGVLVEKANVGRSENDTRVFETRSKDELPATSLAPIDGRLEDLGVGSSAAPAPSEFSSASSNAGNAHSRQTESAGVPWPSILTNTLVGLYLLGVTLMTSRLFVSWMGCRRLIRRARHGRNDQLTLMAQEIAIRLKMRTRPVVSFCQAVYVPVVMGILRPMILLPETAVELTQDQLRVILLHELAHVRRFDHVVNVAQRIVESILFFHPVVWWISRELDRTRELCCDDAVLELGTEPALYAETLFQVARAGLVGRTNEPSLGMAVTGRMKLNGTSELFKRVERILSSSSSSRIRNGSFRKPISVLSPMILVAMAVLIPAISYGLTRSIQAKNAPEPIAISQEVEGDYYTTIRGFVRDSQGEPVAGAIVALQEHPYKSRDHEHLGQKRELASLTVLAKATSAMDGSFEISDAAIPDFHTYYESPYPVTLIAMHDDYGLTWQNIKNEAKSSSVDIELKEKAPLEFSLDLKHPVPLDDVQFEVLGLLTPSNWKALTKNHWALENQLSLYTAPAQSLLDTSDFFQIERSAEKFSFSNMPNDVAVVLNVNAPNHVRQRVVIAHEATIKGAASLAAEAKIIPSSSSVPLVANRVIQLEVVDESSGLPVSNASVGYLQDRYWHTAGKTDKSGRLNFETDSRSGIEVSVTPDATINKRLLSVFKELSLDALNSAAESSPDSTKPEAKKCLIALPTGRSVRGRVVDRKTNQPIGAAKIVATSNPPDVKNGLTFEPLATHTDSNGDYEIFVPANSSGTVMVDQLKGYQTKNMNWETLHITVVSAKYDQATGKAETLALEPDQFTGELRARITVVDETGKPVPNLLALFRERGEQGNPIMPPAQKTDANGNIFCNLPTFYFRSTEMLVVALDRENQRAGWVTIKRPKEITEGNKTFSHLVKMAKEKSPDEPLLSYQIELQSAPVVTGTLRDSANDKPIAGAVVKLQQRCFGNEGLLENFFPEVITDENGAYTLFGLPKLSSSLSASHSSFERRKYWNKNDLFELSPGDSLERDCRLTPKTLADNSKIKPYQVPSVGKRTGEEAFQFLVDEYAAEAKEFRRRMLAAENSATEQLLAKFQSPQVPFVKRMVQLADENRGAKVEAEILSWACNVGISSYSQVSYQLRKQIGDRLIKDHIQSPMIKDCLLNLIYSQANPRAAAELIIRENPDRAIKGTTTFLLAKLNLREIEMVERTMEPRDWRKGMTNQQLESKSVELLEKIVADYADIPYWREGTLGNIAKMELFEIQHLGVGDVPVDIVTVDTNGARVRLSDLKGKVVLLNFWGSWCGPCLRKLPMLNSIAEDYPDDVVVLGIMDDTPENAKTCIAKYGVTWSNIVDRRDSPIHTQWNIDSWPTTYFIGRDGKIAARNKIKRDFRKTVRELVGEKK